jgi:hydrogenase expression/formation protein HypC
MCLAVPGLVKTVDGNSARVMLGGVERDVQLDLTPGVTPGDYVLVHAGFAIQRLDEAEAKETLALLAQIDPDLPIGTGENGA